MGQAILEGILSSQILTPSQIHIFDLNVQKTSELQSKHQVAVASTYEELIQAVDMILLAIKPNICASVLNSIAKSIESKAILSIVTGWGRERIAAYLPASCRILRVMPNTPCMVGAGMTVLDSDSSFTGEEMLFAERIFSSIGQVEKVPSHLMEAVTGVSGSGPAYGYLFIEALADGGVRAGLPRDKAYIFAAQTLLGAAKMVLDTGTHPGQLKDAVCSPAGTTIDAVAALERNGFRAAVLDAVEACVKKATQLKS